MAGATWMRRIALGGAVLTFCLLALGGVVTSRDAGMIFLDWPLSDNSINPPGWLTNADKFSEHGHRILGALTGMVTIALAIVVQRTDRRRWLRALAWFAVVAVSAQGVLGGIRVTEVSTFLALFHGCTGQLYFCLMVALAYFTGRDFNAARARAARGRGADGRDTRLVAILGAGVWLATLVQIVLGARIRHIHGPVHNHLLGAMLVGGSVLWLATVVLVRHGPALRRPALLMVAVLAVQVALGLFTADVLNRGFRLRDATFGIVALPSMHQAVGALLIALETVLVLKAWRRRDRAVSAETADAPRPSASSRPMEVVA